METIWYVTPMEEPVAHTHLRACTHTQRLRMADVEVVYILTPPASPPSYLSSSPLL